MEFGWSQNDAAEFLGLTKRGYQAREQKGEFPLQDLARLAVAFGVSAGYLLTGKVGGECLTAEEQRLLRGWRKIKDADKVYILGIINDALDELLESAKKV